MTYGQVAALAGIPRAARAVGWTAHWGDTQVPWQRVVNRFGKVASGYPGGLLGHAEALRAEQVAVREDWTVDLERYQWIPEEALIERLALSPEALHWLEQRLPFQR